MRFLKEYTAMMVDKGSSEEVRNHQLQQMTCRVVSRRWIKTIQVVKVGLTGAEVFRDIQTHNVTSQLADLSIKLEVSKI